MRYITEAVGDASVRATTIETAHTQLWTKWDHPQLDEILKCLQ
jgi:hypothetical protein